MFFSSVLTDHEYTSVSDNEVKLSYCFQSLEFLKMKVTAEDST